jgi:hypothetical protein
MSLKEAGKNFVQRTAQNPVAWSAYRTFGRLSDYFGRVYGHARFVRETSERDETLRRITQELFPELKVSGGPFKGMRYPAARSYGSTLLPKLLGSYESELHPALEELLAKDYETIVDIGCAEGYYAIGLALRSARAAIYAFDSSSNARRICADMAELNDLANRIQIGSFCDDRLLRSISLGTRALILSDCEGYEGTLFTSDMAEFLAPHDVIIETHDFIDIELSTKMREAFAKTHHIQSIRSKDDIEKAHTYSFPQLVAYNTSTKRLILSERRPAIMEWLVMRTRARHTVSVSS